MVRGTVVRSLAGKDRDGLLAVLEPLPDGRLLAADGGGRPIRRPKAKNPRHLLPVGAVVGEEAMATNRALRKALQRIAEELPDGGTPDGPSGR